MHGKSRNNNQMNGIIVAAAALAVIVAACLTIIFTSGGSSGAQAGTGTHATTGPSCSFNETGPVPKKLTNDSDYCFIKKVTRPASGQ